MAVSINGHNKSTRIYKWKTDKNAIGFFIWLRAQNVSNLLFFDLDTIVSFFSSFSFISTLKTY